MKNYFLFAAVTLTLSLLLLGSQTAFAAISQSQGTTLNQTITEDVSITIEPYISLEVDVANGFTHTLTNATIKTSRDKARDYSKKFYSLFANAFELVGDSNNNAGWKIQVKQANLSDGVNTLLATSLFISNAAPDAAKTNIPSFVNLANAPVGNGRGKMGDNVTDGADETSVLGFGLTNAFQNLLGSSTDGAVASTKAGRIFLTAKLGLLYDTHIISSGANPFKGEITFEISNL